ncbi:MAG: sigma-70 family RNA polymerase sigma factor [Rhodobacteraceae bacterium]|nr:sigma-70 family RNA polymerase sigma factor [Paracoccaceae bacterium]MYF45157.1 sigma-70 family RNA polymerase sigma factor [Paracoccaceae bacterium]MYI91342.1 sigma-70 family RNA polymerase sigma factor [Paracoccaceae bacterium]
MNEDDELLKRFVQGESVAARILIEKYSPQLYRMACRSLGNTSDAEEIVQETMVRLWRFAPEWKPGKARISTWLWRVASNLCIDRIRERERFSDKTTEEVDASESQVASLIHQDRVRAIQIALGQLPARQNQVIVLKYFEGHGNKEVAQIMSASVESIEGLYSRGMKKMREILMDQHSTLGWRE